MRNQQEGRPSRSDALKIAGVYAVAGALWIISSGSLLHYFVIDPSLSSLLEYIKGWFYVLVTTILLGLWLNRYFRKIREANEQLRRSEARWRTLVNTLPDLVWLKDTEGRYLACNERFEKFFGAPESAIIGKTDYDFFDRERAEFFRSNDAAAVASGVPRINEEEVTYAVDGHREILETIKTPMYASDGSLIGVLGISRDITKRKKAENEIQDLNARLEQLNADLELKVKERTSLLEKANKELEAFSSSVSHDLRSPLRHINGYVDLLRRNYGDVLDEKALQYLDTVAGASRQMSTLIDNLLKLSKTGRMELTLSDVDFNQLVREVLDELQPVVLDRRVDWDIQDLPVVPGDVTLLRQVWINLIDNAIKYTNKQDIAKISIGYTAGKKEDIFYVRDNGVGFDMKYADKLFGAFQRLHSQHEFEGSGIGLANVQRIVHKHSGRVWAESKPGKGATFFFSMPGTGRGA